MIASAVPPEVESISAHSSIDVSFTTTSTLDFTSENGQQRQEPAVSVSTPRNSAELELSGIGDPNNLSDEFSVERSSDDYPCSQRRLAEGLSRVLRGVEPNLDARWPTRHLTQHGSLTDAAANQVLPDRLSMALATVFVEYDRTFAEPQCDLPGDLSHECREDVTSFGAPKQTTCTTQNDESANSPGIALSQPEDSASSLSIALPFNSANTGAAEDVTGQPETIDANGLLPAERRLFPRRSSAARVAICPRRRVDDSLSEQERAWQLHGTRLYGRLDDISLNALAFWSNESLRTGELLDLRLSDPQTRVHLDVTAEIVRISICEVNGRPEQRVVCLLLKKLTLEEIEAFSQSLLRSVSVC